MIPEISWMVFNNFRDNCILNEYVMVYLHYLMEYE